MSNYEQKLLRNPAYEKYFKNFVAVYDGKEDPNKRSQQGIVTNDYYKTQLRDKMRKEDEDLMQLGSGNDDEGSNDEDETYN